MTAFFSIIRSRLLLSISLAQIVCLAIVHGPLRPCVAVVSGQDVGGVAGALAGGSVVLAQMLSATLLPIALIALVVAKALATVSGGERRSTELN
jgi:hypothetical protein